jgi:hypothetical protein
VKRDLLGSARGADNSASLGGIAGLGWGYVSRASDDVVCYREEISAQIEVFPEVFYRNELCIPGENRWARNALEAVQYLILHELGHIEAFLYTESDRHLVNPVLYDFDGSRLPKYGNSEAEAWEYASTVMLRKP